MTSESTNPSHACSFTSHSEADTQQFGTHLAGTLTPGAVVALVGELGAGKTRLVQAIAVALGAQREEVNSPTFVLIQEYTGVLPMYHFDTYRLRDTDEFLELGADELLTGDGVCLVEWADRVADVLPRDRITINIEKIGIESRKFHIRAGGRSSEQAVAELIKRISQREE